VDRGLVRTKVQREHAQNDEVQSFEETVKGAFHQTCCVAKERLDWTWQPHLPALLRAAGYDRPQPIAGAFRPPLESTLEAKAQPAPRDWPTGTHIQGRCRVSSVDQNTILALPPHAPSHLAIEVLTRFYRVYAVLYICLRSPHDAGAMLASISLSALP
jgi:hypothetical protein